MNKRIVCIGGGIGTVNLIKGLRHQVSDLTVILSMADEGGSAGRLRRLYDIQPPGDLVSCMTALCEQQETVAKLLTYRFPGDRYAQDGVLAGHKLGSLIMVALRDLTGSFEEAIALFQKTFSISGTFLPVTLEQVTISAKTIEGKEIHGEEAIDLGKYEGERVLESIALHPAHAQANPKAIAALKQADVVIVGPGDLYTTLLPALIVPGIADTLRSITAKKLFVVNVANKPFETKGYSVADFIHAVKKHLHDFPFDGVIANNNFSIEIPSEYHYEYVSLPLLGNTNKENIIAQDLVDEQFPLYHDPKKLASTLVKHL